MVEGKATLWKVHKAFWNSRLIMSDFLDALEMDLEKVARAGGGGGAGGGGVMRGKRDGSINLPDA